ncbi:MAG: tetratricopeptide repeat protein [Desulfomonile sp.]
MKFFAVWVLIAVMVSGCAKQVVRNAVPFEFDKVFSGVFSTPQEDWKEKGLGLAKEGNYDEAMEAFKNHVLENPESFFGFNALAVCYKNVGDSSMAMKNYERALEFASSNEDRAKILANIGNLYSAAKKYQVALGFYKEAYQEFGKNPLYLILIARTFLFLDEYPRARKVLGAAEDVQKDLDKYEKDDDRGLGYYLMAQSYVALDEEVKVFQYLEKALRANPEKFVRKLNQDIVDEQSLLYTIRDDSRLRKALQRYSHGPSPQRFHS